MPLAAGCWLLTAAGCARIHANNPPEVAPLEVPAPPPRVVDSPDTEAPLPVLLPEEPARHPNAGQRRATPPPKTEPAKSDSTKQDQTATPPTTEPPKPPEEPPRPPSATLQTIPAGDEPELERSIRSQLTRAGTDLNRVDYRALSAEGRTQYDGAKGLMRQAEDALRAKNLVFAKTIADKAAALAAQLAGK